MNQQPLTVTEIAAQAIEALGDVFYDPDPLADGYNQDDLRHDVQRTIEDTINQALDQQRTQQTNYLALVLQLAQAAFAERVIELVARREQLPVTEYDDLYRKEKDIEAALGAVAHMGGFNDVHEAVTRALQLSSVELSMRKTWTVVGGYYDLDFDHPENTWVEWVYGDTPQEAVRAASRKIIHNNDGTYTADELVALAVFDGWRMDKLVGQQGEIPALEPRHEND